MLDVNTIILDKFFVESLHLPFVYFQKVFLQYKFKHFMFENMQLLLQAGDGAC